jgi:hypothetical protein
MVFLVFPACFLDAAHNKEEHVCACRQPLRHCRCSVLRVFTSLCTCLLKPIDRGRWFGGARIVRGWSRRLGRLRMGGQRHTHCTQEAVASQKT